MYKSFLRGMLEVVYTKFDVPSAFTLKGDEVRGTLTEASLLLFTTAVYEVIPVEEQRKDKAVEIRSGHISRKFTVKLALPVQLL